MSPREPWQPAFLAVSALVGEPLDVAVDAIGGASDVTAQIVRELGSPSRDTRVKAIARVATAVITGLDAARST